MEIKDAIGLIAKLISPYRKEIFSLINRRNSTSHSEKKCEIDSDIACVVNEINSLRIGTRKINCKQIKLGKSYKLESFLSSSAGKKYKDDAAHMLFRGSYVPQFLFAGGATRFGFGTMWGVDLAALGYMLLGKYKAASKYISKDIVYDFKDKKLGTVSKSDFEKATKKLMRYEKMAPHIHIGMGPRQLLQFRLKIEKIALANSVNPEDILNNTKLVINLNDDIEKYACSEIIKNNYFGFNPENIYVVIQPTFHGLCVDGKSLVEDKKSEQLPYGHGFATLDLFIKGKAFRFGKNGQKKKVFESVACELINSGCVMLGSHRINDMTRWTDDVVNEDKIAFGLSRFEQNKDVVVELVENPHDQKGGHWLRFEEKEFLAETISLLRPDIKAFVDSRENVPYNAFRNMYNIESLNKKIRSEDDIKLNLRYVAGRFYLESVTGDITLAADTVAFQKKSEIIHDLKNISNYIDEGIDFAFQQQKNKRFVELVSNTR